MTNFSTVALTARRRRPNRSARAATVGLATTIALVAVLSTLYAPSSGGALRSAPGPIAVRAMSATPREVAPAPGTSATPLSPSSPTGLPFHGLAPDPLGRTTLSAGTSPAAWGGHAYPPGSEILNRLHASATPSTGGGSGSPSANTSDPLGSCFGVWPSEGGQATYTDNCYGHDEPGIQFYSSMPGSGGNITWNVTLPIARSITDPQSSQYTAIWFGMALSDPYAWLDECFLELQFYPDSTWGSSGVTPGNWVGAAVAWQIEAATEYEDACYYQALTQDGTGGNVPFNMFAGDNISVTMTGWTDSPYGENLSIVDTTSGATSSLTLYNYNYGYPIDPAFVANSVPNGLQWTPGGEMPAVFGFEDAHTTAGPNNNSYGGCSSGPPPPTAQDPAVPCPSYDPGSWVNASLLPWQIAPPTFFNATARETPAQVSFSDDLGGASLIDWLSNGTCNGRDWTSWCTYPWYSYSCAHGAFEFGVDYPETTADFGKALEYTSPVALDGLQLGYYVPLNFSIPTCGAPSATLTVHDPTPSLGSLSFLSTDYAADATLPGLGLGEYSLGAIPTVGANFLRWTTSGGASVTDASNPQTTLWISGDGSVTPVFSTSAVATTAVTFDDAPSVGHAAIFAGFDYTTGIPIATTGSGMVLHLAPGLYSAQAYPAAGYNFTTWTVSGAGVRVLAPDYPFTWISVDRPNATATITAHAVTASVQESVSFGSFGGGTVSFDGGTASSYSSQTVTVGTYPVKAIPSSGYQFAAWYTYSPAVMSDFEAVTNVTVEGGPVYYLYAEFETIPRSVTVNVAPSGGGGFSLDGAPVSGPTTESLGVGTYGILPVPSAGYAFSGATVSNGASLWFRPAVGGGWALDVNFSGTLSLTFVVSTPGNLTFASSPALGGSVAFAGKTYLNGATNASVTNGTYALAALPSPGYEFTGWRTSGPVAVPSSAFAVVNGSGGVLTATFVRGTYLVSFVADTPYIVQATIGGVLLATGDSAFFSGGAIPVNVTLPPGETFLGWTTTGNLSVIGGALATLAVNGSGTLELLARGFYEVASLTPGPTVDLGQTVTFSATIYGPDLLTVSWLGLPPGCASTAERFACAPSATGTYNVSVRATSLDGVTVAAVAGAITVVPALSVTAFTASSLAFTLGSTTTFALTYSGGIGPYSVVYSGLPVGCAGTNATTLDCTPVLAGVSDVTASVTDAAGFLVFQTVEIVVNGPPSVDSVGVDHPVVDAGVPIRFTAAASGGTSPISYQYSGLPPGCIDGGTLVLACTPTTPGDYTVAFSAIDVDGVAAAGTVALVVVAAPTIGAFSASASSVVVNGSVQFTTQVTGGTAPYSYHYANLPAGLGCTSQNLSTFVCSPHVVGTFTITATIVDVFGRSANATTSLIVFPVTGSTSPSGGGGGGGLSGLDLALILGIVLVVAIAIAVAVSRRRPPIADAEKVEPAAPDDTPSFATADDEEIELPSFPSNEELARDP